MNSELQKKYQEKRCALEDVYAAIRDGDIIATSGVLCEPMAFYSRLHEVLPQRRGIEFIKGRQVDYPFYRINDPGCFRIIAHMFDTPMRNAYPNGTVSHIPCNLHNFIDVHLANKPIHKFIAMATPMDENGNFTVSGSVMWEQEKKKRENVQTRRCNVSYR